MAIKPVTPNLRFPPDLVQFPAASADVPLVEFSQTNIDSPLTLALDGADLEIVNLSGNLNADVAFSGARNIDASSMTIIQGGASITFSGSSVISLDISNVAEITSNSTLNVTGTSIPSLALTDFASMAGPGALSVTGNSLLTTTALPALSLLENDFVVALAGNALNASSVNAILAAVLSVVTNFSLTSGTLSLNGGTNAAPTGQGITDKADLITAGITVTTN